MVFPLPFTGPPPENGVTLARGSYGFLNVRVTVNDQPYTPDPLVYANITRIEDPDGVDVTNTWVTKALDPAGLPGGGADPYDENHATYVGDDASPENVGLFQSSSWVSQKILVPVGAEETILDPNRSYKVFYDLRIGGVTITDADGELFETFNVGPPGVLVWGGGIISADDVKADLSTSLDDPTIEALIDRAQDRVRSTVLATCKYDIQNLTELPGAIADAIILRTQLYIVRRDTSAGGIAVMRKQGTKQVRYSASSDKLSDQVRGDLMDAIREFCYDIKSNAEFRTFRRPNTAGKYDYHNTRNR